MTAEATRTPTVDDPRQETCDRAGDTVDSPDSAVEYRLWQGPDSWALLLDCPDPAEEPARWAARIQADLADLDLPRVPDEETIRQLLAEAAGDGAPLREYPLIKGRAPVPGKSSRLSWARQFFATGWIVDEESGRINFREKVENCSVHRNELLLRVYKAVEGVPGEDIFGGKIPVEKVEKIRVRCGKGVSEVDEGDTIAFYSDLDGRVRFTDSTLAVDDLFHVTGHVGLATGNIHHPGSVVVDGDILAGSVVEAGGDIVVKGMVEESVVITCGGTLTVAGGILGGAGNKIRTGGDLEARYIRDADVAAEGDILVAKQIFHSRTRCRGSVLVPDGRIAGGTTIALRGIRVGTAGAPGTTATELMAGVDYSLQAQADLYHEKIERLEATLKPIDNALRNAGTAGRDLSEGVQQVVENMALKRMKLQEAISHQHMRVDKLMEASREEAGLFVVMFKEVWSGTTIQLGTGVTRVKRSINKPRIALLREDRVRVLPLGENNLPPEQEHPRCPRKII